MRTLAIDLGEKRVGLALGDDAGKLATPLKVLEVPSSAAALDPVLRLIAQEEVQRVLVGVPLNMDDSLGPAAEAAIAWGRTLAERSSVAVAYVDERLSTFAAQEQITARQREGRHLTRAKKKQLLDSLAAAGLLQAFFDGKLPPLAV